jgi:hypothetical protein
MNIVIGIIVISSAIGLIGGVIVSHKDDTLYVPVIEVAKDKCQNNNGLESMSSISYFSAKKITNVKITCNNQGTIGVFLSKLPLFLDLPCRFFC